MAYTVKKRRFKWIEAWDVKSNEDGTSAKVAKDDSGYRVIYSLSSTGYSGSKQHWDTMDEAVEVAFAKKRNFIKGHVVFA